MDCKEKYLNNSLKVKEKSCIKKKSNNIIKWKLKIFWQTKLKA